MAEVTLTPIPYNGGTIDSYIYRDVIWLNSNKFLAIYSQRAPNYTFCIVFEVNGMKTNTPTLTVLRSQALADYSAPASNSSVIGHRLYKLNSNDVLVFRQVSMFNGPIDIAVLNVDPTTNVITRVNANALSITYPNLLVTGSSILIPQFVQSQARLTACTMKENVVVYSIPTSTTTWKMVRVNWDATSKQLTSTDIIDTDTGGSISSANGFMSFQRLLTDTDNANPTFYALWVLGDSSSSTVGIRWYGLRTNAFYYGDSTSGWTKKRFGNATGVVMSNASMAFVPISPDLMKFYYDNGDNYNTIVPSSTSTSLLTPGTKITVAGFVSVKGFYSVGSVLLPNNKMLNIIEGGSYSNSYYQPATPLYAVIVDHSTNTVTQGTSTSVEIVPNTHKLNQKLPLCEKIDDSLVVVYSFTSTDQFALTFLYASAVTG